MASRTARCRGLFESPPRPPRIIRGGSPRTHDLRSAARTWQRPTSTARRRRSQYRLMTPSLPALQARSTATVVAPRYCRINGLGRTTPRTGIVDKAVDYRWMEVEVLYFWPLQS